ncbi:MAG: response regulator, partial [Dehalococcoidia bacterium]
MDEAKGTVLVVDDEESIRGIVSRRLEAEGYSCVTAADGKGALWESFMHDFDLVLTDIKMPGMSGLEVLSQITNDHPDTGVIMITGLAETQTAVEAMKLGAYDYVTKPFNLDDLVMRVERALERRRLLLENKDYQLQLEQKVERQLGQIRQYYREAIEALAREEMAVEELDTLRHAEPRQATGSKETGVDSFESPSSIKGFAKKLSLLIGSGTADSLHETEAVPSEQTETTTEEPQDQLPVWQQEEGGEEDASDLHHGTVELVVAPPVGLHQMMHLHEHLQDIPQIQVLNLGGSVDNGITIRLTVNSPTPLLRILGDLPEVKRALDDVQEAEKIVPGRKGENQPVTRIVVELLRASTTEAA